MEDAEELQALVSGCLENDTDFGSTKTSRVGLAKTLQLCKLDMDSNEDPKSFCQARALMTKEQEFDQ